MGHPLLLRLRELDFPTADYAIFGSGPLLVRGWIEDAGDLDLIARGAALDAARSAGKTIHLAEHDVDVIGIDGGKITVGTSWAYGEFDIDELIDTAELIEGFPCVLLDHVVAFKQVADRPKDRDHLAIIAKHRRPG